MRHRYANRIGNPRDHPGLVHARLKVASVAIRIAIAQGASAVVPRAVHLAACNNRTRVFTACCEIGNVREPAECRHRSNAVAVCAELAVPVFAPTKHAPRRVDAAGVKFTHFDTAQRRECRDFCGRGDNCPRYRRNPELAGVAPPTKEFSCTHFGTRRIIAHFDLCGRR